MRQQRSDEYSGYRRAGIRLSEHLAPQMAQEREHRETADLYAAHMYDKAHNVMLVESEIVAPEIGAAILSALRALETESGGAVGARMRIGGGLHSGEYYLIRTLGEDIGGWDHVGRSSACLAAVCQRIVQRDQLLDLLAKLCRLRNALLELAENHLETVIPGTFTTQIVQPMSLGHYLLGAAYAFARHADRLRELYGRTNLNPGGGIVRTGTAFPINRDRVAELLGFSGVVENAADAIQSDDVNIECFACLAMIARQTDTLVSDFNRWLTSEAGYLDVADRFAAGSSMAMNMKTPLLPGPGLADEALGDLVKAFSPLGLLGGITSGVLFPKISRSLGILSEILPTVTVDHGRIAEVLRTRAHSGGTDLGALLVTARDMGWRTAHQICGIMFRHCAERKITAGEVTGELLDEAAIEYFGKPLGLTTEDIQNAVDPDRIIQSRRHRGGSYLPETRRQLAQLVEGLMQDEGWLTARRNELEAAAKAFEAAIDVIIGSKKTEGVPSQRA